MCKPALCKVLNKYLTSVLDPLGSENLKFGVLSLSLANVKLCQTFLQTTSLDLPVKLCEVSVKEVKVSVGFIASFFWLVVSNFCLFAVRLLGLVLRSWFEVWLLSLPTRQVLFGVQFFQSYLHRSPFLVPLSDFTVDASKEAKKGLEAKLAALAKQEITNLLQASNNGCPPTLVKML